MPLLRWLVLFDPLHVQCIHCGTRLIPRRRWRRRYYFISLVAMLLIIAPSALAYVDLLPYDNLLQMFFVVVGLTFVLFLLLSIFFWKRFEYEIESNEP
jgi:hypothetical protein